MANPLLVRALPEHLAERGQAIEIVEKLSAFERLVAIVEADLKALPAAKRPHDWRNSPVNIGLQFGWADARLKLPLVTGLLDARVYAVCQRCLEHCELHLSIPVSLLLIRDDAGGAGDDEFEVWELSEKKLRPIDIVEEMLIMALPMAAKHASLEDCGPLAQQVDPVPEESVRPFADLKSRIDNRE